MWKLDWGGARAWRIIINRYTVSAYLVNVFSQFSRSCKTDLMCCITLYIIIYYWNRTQGIYCNGVLVVEQVIELLTRQQLSIVEAHSNANDTLFWIRRGDTTEQNSSQQGLYCNVVYRPLSLRWSVSVQICGRAQSPVRLWRRSTAIGLQSRPAAKITQDKDRQTATPSTSISNCLNHQRHVRRNQRP